MLNLSDQIRNGVIELNEDSGNKDVNIIFAGDLCPDRRTEKLIMQNRLNTIYGDLLIELDNKDISVVNLECPLTKNMEPISKIGPNLIAAPETIECVKAGRFDIVTMANNHILDQGEQGLIDTMNLCDEYGIKTVGVGKNIKEASQFLVIKIKGITIAILNFAECEFSIATKRSAGANPLNPISNYHQIIDAKKQADVVFVIVHGGIEQAALPSPAFVETLRFFADLGAAAVIAHHSHRASGIEVYNNVPIFYSLGNFLFDRDYNLPFWFESFFTKVTLSGNAIKKFELIPYFQFKNDVGLHLMNAIEKRSFLEAIADLSQQIQKPDTLENHMQLLCSKKRIKYLSNAYSLNRLQRKMLKQEILKPLLLNNNNLLTMLNMYRCQSHREVMIKTLEDELSLF